MAYRHIFIRTHKGGVRISTDEKGQIGILRLEERIASLFANGYMAAITTGVSHRVTNLTRQLVTVLRVHCRGIWAGQNRCVTGFARGALETGITMVWWGHLGVVGWSRVTGCALGRFAVQLGAAMAMDTIHSPLSEVNIAWNAFVFAHILIPHAAAVTGGTRASHRRGAFEQVTVEQAASSRDRRAHMTIATGGVALGTVIIECRMQGVVVLRHAAGVHGSEIALLREVQTVDIRAVHVGMTFSADGIFSLAWAVNQSLMSGLFIVGQCPSMAVHTGFLTMYVF